MYTFALSISHMFFSWFNYNNNNNNIVLLWLIIYKRESKLIMCELWIAILIIQALLQVATKYIYKHFNNLKEREYLEALTPI